MAFSIPIVGYGVIFNLWLVIPGIVLLMGSLYGWALEPADDLDIDDHGHDPGHDPEPEGSGDDAKELANV